MTSLNRCTLWAGRWRRSSAFTGAWTAGRPARTVELFQQVGIPDPAARYDAYPRQLSGGLRQRVMIAMAMPVSRSSSLPTSPPPPWT